MSFSKILLYTIFLVSFIGELVAKNQDSAPIKELDSLERLLLNTSNDSTFIGLKYEIGIKAGITRMSYWDSLLANAHTQKIIQYEAKILDRISSIYSDKDEIALAIEFSLRALHAIEQIGHKAEMLPIISRLIRLHYLILDRKNTLIYIYKGLKIAEELKERKKILDFYSEVALYYMSSGEANRALQIHFKCLRECEKIGYNYGIASSLVDIGSDYYALHREEKAGYYYLQSLAYVDKLKDSPFAGYHIYNSACAAYRFRKKYDSAYYFAKKGYELAKLIGSKKAVAVMILALAGIKHDIGEYQQAEKLALQSLVICKSINFVAEFPLIYQLLESIYTKQKNYKKALEAYKIYIKINDSLSNEQVRKQAIEKEFAYNYGKKEQAYNRVVQQNQIQRLKLREDRILMSGLIIFLLALTLIAYLFILKNKYRVEHDKIIMEQKLLLSQMSPHFIFNSLNSIQQLIMTGQNSQAEIYLIKFSKLIRELLESSTKEKLTIKEEVEMLEVYLEMESLRFGNSFSYSIVVNENIDVDGVFIPHLIIQPFVENAIWHGLLPKTDDRYLKIEFTQRNKKTIHCSIDDNGVGRSASKKNETLLYKKSLALSLIKKRIDIMNKSASSKGSMTVIDKKDLMGNSIGTNIMLVLPVLN